MLVTISTLRDYDTISDVYALDMDTLDVINTKTGKKKSINILKANRYPVVYLSTKGGRKRNVTMHRLVARAFYGNDAEGCVEHLNDDRSDYRPENLLFSTTKRNSMRAFENGKRDIPVRIFRLQMCDGRVFVGPMKGIASEVGISRATLYDHFLYKRDSRVRSGIESIIVAGQQTIERYGARP